MYILHIKRTIHTCYSIISLARLLPPLHFLQTDVIGRFVKNGGEEAVWLARLVTVYHLLLWFLECTMAEIKVLAPGGNQDDVKIMLYLHLGDLVER